MKRFTITQLLLATTWCAIACVFASRYFASPPYAGDISDITGTALVLDSGSGEFYTEFMADAVDRTIPWHPADPNPPISAKHAIAIGDRLRRSKLEGNETWKWSLDYIALQPLDGKNGKWCWEINFRAHHADLPSGNMDFRYFSAYVLMNGEVIEPELEDPNAEPDSVFFNADL